jgi:transposase-like protein
MKKQPAEAVVREIRSKTRRKFSAEDKIRIVLEGLRGEETIGAPASLAKCAASGALRIGRAGRLERNRQHGVGKAQHEFSYQVGEHS